jgi:hypothetical protein
MKYFVVGGRYRDTSFRDLVRPDPPEGPFDRYQDALASWRAKSVRHIDEAFVRYTIVPEAPAAEAATQAAAG